MTLYLGNNLISGIAHPTEPTRNLGQIIESIVPLTDAGLHLLDGALINGSGIYADFVTAIAGLVTDYPDLFETEANWQSAVTTYGVCGKFVYDDVNNTVRLPKITGKLDGTTDVTALGDLVSQYVKLPNITGSVGGFCGLQIGKQNTMTYLKGAFYRHSDPAQMNQGGGDSSNALGFDASRSSSVYSGDGTDTKIHEQAINVLYYIVIATSTKTDIEVDIDEIATDLNSKADTDLTNCTNVASIKMAHNAMPSGTSIALTLGASGSDYVAPADGWFGANVNWQQPYSYLSMNNKYVVGYCQTGISGAAFGLTFVPVAKGDTVNISYNAISVNWFRFTYAQGSESEAS